MKKTLDLLQTQAFWINLFSTIGRVFASFVFSFFIGTILGFFCGKSSFIKDFFKIPLSILKTTPVAATILILLFLFKSTTVPIVVSVLMSLPVIVSTVECGFTNTKSDEQLFQMSKVFKLSKKQIFKYIRFPKLFPFIKSAVLSCFGMTWKVVVAGEIICVPRLSIGNMMATAQVHLESEEVFALTICLVIICFVFERILILLFKILENKKNNFNNPKNNFQPTYDFGTNFLPHTDLVIENLNIAFGEKSILKNFSATFESEKITALIGQSGCGKTTLLNYILSHFENVSICFQEPRLLEKESCLLNVALPVLKNPDGRKDFDFILNTLKIMDMESKRFNPCKNLSGGERQRVNLARALAFPSSILLLDEPFSGIDETTKYKIMDFIKSVNKEKPRTIIFVTHNPEEANYLADNIFSLDQNQPSIKLPSIYSGEPGTLH